LKCAPETSANVRIRATSPPPDAVREQSLRHDPRSDDDREEQRGPDRFSDHALREGNPEIR